MDFTSVFSPIKTGRNPNKGVILYRKRCKGSFPVDTDFLSGYTRPLQVGEGDFNDVAFCSLQGVVCVSGLFLFWKPGWPQ